jgi:ATP-binding cassette subfamily B multidrug efflux pump
MSEQNKGMKPPGGRPGGGGFGGGPGGGPGMRMPAEKAKDFKGTLRRLTRYCVCDGGCQHHIQYFQP